jgi:hypothetical protein
MLPGSCSGASHAYTPNGDSRLRFFSSSWKDYVYVGVEAKEFMTILAM